MSSSLPPHSLRHQLCRPQALEAAQVNGSRIPRQSHSSPLSTPFNCLFGCIDPGEIACRTELLSLMTVPCNLIVCHLCLWFENMVDSGLTSLGSSPFHQHVHMVSRQGRGTRGKKNRLYLSLSALYVQIAAVFDVRTVLVFHLLSSDEFHLLKRRLYM